MSNYFYISLAPEIAALDTKIDTIDTEVDAIRAVDLPAIDTLIDTVDTVVDSIRSTDVPNIQTNIDANETKIDTIDGIVDAIKLKTDLLPQNFRGALGVQYFSTANPAFQTALTLSGSGKLIHTVVKCGNAGDTVELRITIDGVLSQPISHTGDVLWQRAYFSEQNFGNPTFDLLLLPVTTSDSNLLNVDFQTSLLVELRRSAGVTVDVQTKSLYSLDT